MPAIDSASRRAVALLVAGALLPLAACSSSSDDATGDGPGGAARDVRSAGRDQTASGGTLTWAVDAMPRTLNAFRPEAGAATDRVAAATLPALFTLDANARPRANPDFVTSAEVTAREPHQKVVYELNPKARWSDGRAIGAEDFAAQVKALNGKDRTYWSARNAGYERIDTVRKGGSPHTVEVTFAKPYADWRSLFTPLYPKQVTSTPEAFNESARTSLPVAGGPFRVEKADAEGGTVTLQRNTKWWGDRAKLDRIELKAVPRHERQAALQSGELGIAGIGADTARSVSDANASGKNGEQAGAAAEPRGAAGAGLAGLPGLSSAVAASGAAASESLRAWAESRMTEQARADLAQERRAEQERQRKRRAEQKQLRGYTVRKALGPGYTQLALNGAEGPLSDERVRRAVARALDRKALARKALSGTGLPHEPLGSHLRMRHQEGYADNSGAIGGEDLESAQSLLADAGWTGGPAEPDTARGGPDKAGGKGAGDKETGDKDADAAPSGAGEAQGTATGTQAAGPQQPRHRAEARNAAVQLSAEQLDRVSGKPLGIASPVASQHAWLRLQAARAQVSAAEAAGSQKKAKAARAELEKAQSLRAAADEMQLLAGGEAEAVRMKDGEPLALRFVLPAGPGSQQVRETGEEIAGMLNAIGVRTEIKRVDEKGYFQDHIAAGNYDLALFSWPATAYPATDARPIFAKPRAAGDGSLLVEQNYTRVGTDQIDRLFEQAAGELDDGARKDLLKKADARIWAAAGSVPLYQRPQLVAVQDEIVNAGAFGFETPRYQDIGYQK